MPPPSAAHNVTISLKCAPFVSLPQVFKGAELTIVLVPNSAGVVLFANGTRPSKMDNSTGIYIKHYNG